MSFDADAYGLRLRAMSNRELISEAGSRVLQAAVMARFRGPLNDGSADDMCDALYDEAVRRGNPDLYQRGFNSAASSQGHSGMTQPTPTPISHGEPVTAQLQDGEQ